MSSILTVENVAAGYGVRTVLRQISFSLAHGEILVVSGANGSGKSTLLRLLAGLQQPTAGTITYHVGAVNAPPEWMNRSIGWVAPELSLYRELSGLENLRFFARVRGLQPTDADLRQLLAEVGLDGRGDDRLAAYSSGMTHRLRYAYALLHRPPILLLDEPTVTLDTRGVAVVDRLIAAQRGRGICVIATNDPRELRYADLVLRIGS